MFNNSQGAASLGNAQALKAGGSQMRREETNILSKMVTGRNQLFLEPFDIFDPHHPMRGRKRFDPSFRPLRSKINIKINAPEAARKKRVNQVTVEQGVIDDFNKKYAENCDQ